MTEVHVLDIKYIEINSQEELEFKYKPEVPKLKLVGTLLNSENEEEEEGLLFLTQKQLNQLLMGKDIELKLVDERWVLGKPLTRDQIKSMGLVTVDCEFMGRAGDIGCYEAIKVSE